MIGWLIVSTAVIVLVRDPAPGFVFDAAYYWAGADALTDQQDAYVVGGLDYRGLFTVFVHLPAILVSHAFGSSVTAASWIVLVQNSLLIATLGAVIVPLLVRRFVAVRHEHVALSAMLTVLLLSGFAPFPLMDLAALVCAALAVLLMSGPRAWPALAGGGFAGLAMNLRPAYALPLVLVLLVVFATRWRRGPLALLGAGGVLAAQTLYGWMRAGVISPMPPESTKVAEIQMKYAAYGVRYDTIPYTAEDPRLWHCSPAMADAVAGNLPTSTSGLLQVFVDALPSSAQFALDKVAATLQWSWATPYADPGDQALLPLGVVVATVSCAGLLALMALLRTRGDGRMVAWALVSIALGVAVTLVGSAPEARFALPVVLVGIVGSLVAIARWRPSAMPTRSTGIWVVSAVALSAIVIALGWHGLQHDLPRGDMTVEQCQAA